MKEKEFISTIKKIVANDYIGDDCAHLKDLGIVVSQDSLVEDVHFKREFITPYQLGYKSVMVNISDICASGAEPCYITISLSLPKNIDNSFVENFYLGCQNACKNNIKIVGGDITGSDKIFISVCAIGNTKNRNISSRKNAKIGQKVIVSGVHGSSSAGLLLLKQNNSNYQNLIKSHLEPCAQIEFSKRIATANINQYAMTDTSDGLMDALFNISNESGVCLEIDFYKIPYDKNIKIFENWKDLLLFGGEDYQLVATVPMDFELGYEIGFVKDGCGVDLIVENCCIHYSEKEIENHIYNHF